MAWEGMVGRVRTESLRWIMEICWPQVVFGDHQRRLDTTRNASWVNNPLRFTRALMACGSLTRRLKIPLKRNFAHHIFDINAGHRKFFCFTILWITLPSHGDRWRQQNRGFFWSSPRVKMSPRAMDRFNRDPTNRGRSLQLFLLHILPLCNVWRQLNTCASRVMQVYASHVVAFNKSRLKILSSRLKVPKYRFF